MLNAFERRLMDVSKITQCILLCIRIYNGYSQQTAILLNAKAGIPTNAEEFFDLVALDQLSICVSHVYPPTKYCEGMCDFANAPYRIGIALINRPEVVNHRWVKHQRGAECLS